MYIHCCAGNSDNFVALHSKYKSVYLPFLFDKIVFGPVHGRRLGVSLGMNLLLQTRSTFVQLVFIVDIVK